ncbi:MAG: class I SAM-dependent methyltransferase [Anaerolineae bacterium]
MSSDSPSITINCCRSCSSSTLLPVVFLGNTPLANALLKSPTLSEPEAVYPLKLVYCPQCTLLQITDTLTPESLFREYVYFSSYSDTALENARGIVERLIKDRQLSSQHNVVELASNDGYLLQYYQQHGIPVLGIEPALNIAQVAQAKGVPTIPEFFGELLAQQLAHERRHADVIHANNVLAHVADLNSFVAGIAILLKDSGVAVLEMPYVRDMIDNVEFDTIYHEHLSYFTLHSLDCLFQRHHLQIVDVERLSIHGGSLRLFVQHPDRVPVSQRVRDLLAEEVAGSVDQYEYYRSFGEKIEQLRHDLLALLNQLKRDGKQIAAYGASAKGSTLLNYCGIGTETLDFLVDRSKVKQGLYTPGTHLRIEPVSKLLEAQPDYVLLLVWNFATEILNQQFEYRTRGGKFIVPIPNISVV